MNDKPETHDETGPGREALRGRDEELAREALALPRELAPPRDLWGGIESRVAARQRRIVALRRSAAGASILLAAAAVALFVRSARSPRGPDPLPSQVASEEAPPASAEPDDVIFPEEASYRAALAALGPTFAEGERSLPEKDRAAVKASLGAIDAAIIVTRSSLVNDPEDPDLRAELDAEYEQKIDTMNDVLDWTTRS